MENEKKWKNGKMEKSKRKSTHSIERKGKHNVHNHRKETQAAQRRIARDDVLCVPYERVNA